MDFENIVNQLVRDFEELAAEHGGTADNEHIWALGSEGEEAKQHEQYAEEHRAIAEFYRKMAKNPELAWEQVGGM